MTGVQTCALPIFNFSNAFKSLWISEKTRKRGISYHGNRMTPETPPSINGWLEDELYQQYRNDRQAVDSSWTHLFEAPPDGGAAVAAEIEPAAEPAHRYQPVLRPPSITTITIEPSQEQGSRALPAPAVPIGPEDQALPLRGPALRIAENMTASLTMPVATSQRVMPVKVMEENRRIINERRSASGASKISFTHLVAWAIVRSLEKVPALNDAFAQSGADSFRVRRGHVNIGLAVDVAGKDGARSLKVPSIKSAESQNFATFLAAYDDLVVRAQIGRAHV